MANEKQLIKADPIANGIALYVAENAYLNDTALDVLKMVAKWLEDAPTVDAVEVVRCKNCEYWADGVAGCTDHVKCCKIGFYMVGENGYCVYGKQKA